MTSTKRRGHGDGSVYQRSDGRWFGSVEVGYYPGGGRRRQTVSASTRAKAEAKLKALQRKIADDGVSTTDVRTTVKAWAAQWLEITKATSRPNSWITDRSAVGWIVTTIGHKRVTDLTPADVRAVATALRDAGKSTSTANRYQRTLRVMLKAAIQEGHQVPTRVIAVSPATAAVSDRDAMPIAEALACLLVASELKHGSRWAMALLHGARQAECLGLTRDCISNGAVRFEWQLQALPYVDLKNKELGFRLPDGFEVRHLHGRFHLTRPKSRAGFRVAPLVPAMSEALEDWLTAAPDNPWGLVWPTKDGLPCSDNDDRHEWYGIQGVAAVGHPAGRYYYVHEARHTTATQLLEAGVDPHQVTAIMGHSSILTSRGYMHPSNLPALAALESVAGRLQLGSGPE